MQVGVGLHESDIKDWTCLACGKPLFQAHEGDYNHVEDEGCYWDFPIPTALLSRLESLKREQREVLERIAEELEEVAAERRSPNPYGSRQTIYDPAYASGMKDAAGRVRSALESTSSLPASPVDAEDTE